MFLVPTNLEFLGRAHKFRVLVLTGKHVDASILTSVSLSVLLTPGDLRLWKIKSTKGGVWIPPIIRDACTCLVALASARGQHLGENMTGYYALEFTSIWLCPIVGNAWAKFLSTVFFCFFLWPESTNGEVISENVKNFRVPMKRQTSQNIGWFELCCVSVAGPF